MVFPLWRLDWRLLVGSAKHIYCLNQFLFSVLFSLLAWATGFYFHNQFSCIVELNLEEFSLILVAA